MPLELNDTLSSLDTDYLGGVGLYEIDGGDLFAADDRSLFTFDSSDLFATDDSSLFTFDSGPLFEIDNSLLTFSGDDPLTFSSDDPFRLASFDNVRHGSEQPTASWSPSQIADDFSFSVAGRPYTGAEVYRLPGGLDLTNGGNWSVRTEVGTGEFPWKGFYEGWTSTNPLNSGATLNNLDVEDTAQSVFSDGSRLGANYSQIDGTDIFSVELFRQVNVDSSAYDGAEIIGVTTLESGVSLDVFGQYWKPTDPGDSGNLPPEIYGFQLGATWPLGTNTTARLEALDFELPGLGNALRVGANLTHKFGTDTKVSGWVYGIHNTLGDGANALRSEVWLEEPTVWDSDRLSFFTGGGVHLSRDLDQIYGGFGLEYDVPNVVEAFLRGDGAAEWRPEGPVSSAFNLEAGLAEVLLTEPVEVTAGVFGNLTAPVTGEIRLGAGGLIGVNLDPKTELLFGADPFNASVGFELRRDW